MSDPLRSLTRRVARLRDQNEAIYGVHADATTAFMGQVYSPGTIPTAPGAVYLFRPTAMAGTESEGGSITVTGDTTRSVPAVVLGLAPVAGDLLKVYQVEGRWFAEKRSVTGGGGGIIVLPYPGCVCNPVPATAYLVYTPATSDISEYQNSTLKLWNRSTGQGTPPTYLPNYPANTGTTQYWSESPWIDKGGAYNYYTLRCNGSLMNLALGQYGPGYSILPYNIYRWTITGQTTGPNTCSPYALTVGVAEGSDVPGSFSVMG